MIAQFDANLVEAPQCGHELFLENALCDLVEYRSCRGQLCFVNLGLCNCNLFLHRQYFDRRISSSSVSSCGIYPSPF
jgi:hypothetical protein